MIDTLKLRLTDFEVSSDHAFEMGLGSFTPKTGVFTGDRLLWHDENGLETRAANAFYNGENFKVDFKMLPDALTADCFVTFSPSKVLTGDNFILADGVLTAKACKEIGKMVKEIGLKTNIDTANVSRLDLAKTVALIDPCQNYFPVLGTLKGNRVAKRDYGTTHLWENKSQQVCVYDKLAEMQARKQATGGLPANSMRFEWRMLKSPKFQAATGMKTVKDAYSNYDHLTSCYNETLKKQLFKFTVPQFNLLSTPQLEDEFKVFADRGDACWWGVCMRAKAFQGVSAFDFDVMLSAALKSAKNRMEESRIKRDFDKWRADALSLPTVSAAQRTTAELYSELQSKVLAA